MSKEHETCENCVYDGAHSNLCDTCGDYGMSHFRADDIVSSCENCAKLEAELAKNQFNPDYDATAGALADAQEAIGVLQSERDEYKGMIERGLKYTTLQRKYDQLKAELAAQETLIAKHVVNGLTYADRVHGLQDELAACPWVPVSERLPDKTWTYLVLPHHKHCPTLWYQDGWYWYDDADDSIDEAPFQPTHWMPIPPLTKGDKT